MFKKLISGFLGIFILINISFFLFYIGSLHCEELFPIYIISSIILLLNSNFPNFTSKIRISHKKSFFFWDSLFSIFIILGSILWDRKDNFPKPYEIIIIYLGCFFLVHVFLCVINSILDNYFPSCFTIKFFEKSYMSYLCLALLFFLCWLPAFLSNFPGIVTSDAGWQWGMATGIYPISSHHPPLHTLLIWLSQHISMLFTNGNLNSTLAVSIYSIIQMLILSLAFAYTVKFLYSQHISKYLFIFSILFYALFPLNALASIDMTKDVIFSMSILILTVQIYKIYQTDGFWINNNTHFICLFISFAAVLLLRSNGFMVVLITAFILDISYHKNVKRYSTIFILILILCLVKGPVYNNLGITKGNITEALGMPINQIANIIVNEEYIDENDLKLINEVLPIDTIKNIYSPYYSDPIKFHENFNSQIIVENKSAYFKLWIKLLLNYPLRCLEASANLTIGYWYPGVSKGAISYDVYNKSATLLTIDAKAHPTIFKESLYDYFIGIDVRNNVFLSWIFSIGNIVILVFFCLQRLCYKKSIRKITIILPTIIVWLSLLFATPSYCETRYVYSLFFCLPVYLTIILNEHCIKNKYNEIFAPDN